MDPIILGPDDRSRYRAGYGASCGCCEHHPTLVGNTGLCRPRRDEEVPRRRARYCTSTWTPSSAPSSAQLDPALEGVPSSSAVTPPSGAWWPPAPTRRASTASTRRMPLAKAGKLCPHAVYLHGNFQAYVHYSRLVRDILEEYTPLGRARRHRRGLPRPHRLPAGVRRAGERVPARSARA